MAPTPHCTPCDDLALPRSSQKIKNQTGVCFLKPWIFDCSLIAEDLLKDRYVTFKPRFFSAIDSKTQRGQTEDCGVR